MRQIALRFQIPERVTRGYSLLSLDLADYRHGAMPEWETPQPGRGVLLVVGNHFPHKYLVPTANALAAAFPERRVVALGQAKPGTAADEPLFNPYALPQLSEAANLDGVHVGQLSDAEIAGYYAEADAVIFPSHYEGFGIPLLEALAARRPVFVRPLPVFRELWEGQNRNPNIHFYETTDGLLESLAAIPGWRETSPPPADGAKRSAGEIRDLLEAALLKADYHAIAGRLRALRQDAPAIVAPEPEPESLAESRARYVAERVEFFARRLFQSRLFYFFSRSVFRALRPVLQFARRGLRLRKRPAGPKADPTIIP